MVDWFTFSKIKLLKNINLLAYNYLYSSNLNVPDIEITLITVCTSPAVHANAVLLFETFFLDRGASYVVAVGSTNKWGCVHMTW